MRFLLLSLSILLATACAHDLHDNFQSHMSSGVGESIDDSHNWARKDRFVRAVELPGGNIENEYKFRASCRYFYEYEPSSRVIVGWRYEGKETDCAIAP